MHPLDKFKYCPICGSSHFEEQDEKSKRCNECGFEYYMKPSSANVALILNEKEELLVVRREKEPANQVQRAWQELCHILYLAVQV